MHDTLNSERFVDQAPTEVYATLLDAGKYLCSVRTMYRILEEHAELRERRDQLRHPNYEKPVLLATGPNQVWSWDITKLLGPMKWVYFGTCQQLWDKVLLDFFGAHPERFVNGAPKPPEIPSAAWINPPTTKTTHQIGAQAVSEASDDPQVPLICNIYGEPVVSNSAASVTRTQHNHAQTQGNPA